MTLILQKHWLHFLQLAHNGAGGVIIAKTDEEKKLFVTSNTSDQSVFYTVSTDVAKFNFSGKKFAILSYDNFKRYFNSCQVSTKDNTGLPVLKTVNDDEGEPVTVKIEQPLLNAKLSHTLAMTDCMIKPSLYDEANDSFFSIDVNNESAKFALSSEQMNYLQKMIGTIGATNIKFKVDNGICTITLYNPKTSDVFSQSYAVTCDPAEQFEVSIAVSSFGLLPTAGYNITIDKEGILHFAQDRTDDISVNLYIMTLA